MILTDYTSTMDQYKKQHVHSYSTWTKSDSFKSGTLLVENIVHFMYPKWFMICLLDIIMELTKFVVLNKKKEKVYP